jgi:cardiolipin synthase
MVPVFAWLLVTERDLAALVVLLAASLSDFVDGWLARRLDQTSRLGELLDPVADRLYVVVALLALAGRETIPWGFVAVLVARDVVLAVNVLVLRAHGVAPLPVHTLGKAATFVLFVGFPVLLLAEAVDSARPWALPLAWALLLWGAGLYWWAGAGYLVHARRVLAGSSPDRVTGRPRRPAELS